MSEEQEIILQNLVMAKALELIKECGGHEVILQEAKTTEQFASVAIEDISVWPAVPLYVALKDGAFEFGIDKDHTVRFPSMSFVDPRFDLIKFAEAIAEAARKELGEERRIPMVVMRQHLLDAGIIR